MFSFYLGVDLPLDFGSHEIVASNDKKALFAIGNGFKSPKWNSRDIYKFACTNSITHCSWTKIPTKLQYVRTFTVAMRIPNALAYKLCKGISQTTESSIPSNAKGLNQMLFQNVQFM